VRGNHPTQFKLNTFVKEYKPKDASLPPVYEIVEFALEGRVHDDEGEHYVTAQSVAFVGLRREDVSGAAPRSQGKTDHVFAEISKFAQSDGNCFLPMTKAELQRYRLKAEEDRPHHIDLEWSQDSATTTEVKDGDEKELEDSIGPVYARIHNAKNIACQKKYMSGLKMALLLEREKEEDKWLTINKWETTFQAFKELKTSGFWYDMFTHEGNKTGSGKAGKFRITFTVEVKDKKSSMYKDGKTGLDPKVIVYSVLPGQCHHAAGCFIAACSCLVMLCVK